MKEQTFMNEIDEFSLYIDKIENSSGVAKGVLIFQKDDSSEYPILVIGENASWENDAMVLKNADFYKFDSNGKEELRGKFDEKKIPLSAYAKDMKIKIDDVEGMSIIQIVSELKNLEKEELAPYLVEKNKKIAVPISTIFLGILGVLLANGHHRSGKGTNFALSLFIIFTYIIILNSGMVLAKRGKFPIIPAVWISDVLLATLTYLIYKHKAKVM